MPPIQKVTKEEIVENAMKLVKKDGIESLNARSLAKALHCSVQPIFHNFQNMEELQSEVLNSIYLKYKEYMLSGKEKEKEYKEMGLSYIKFAKDYPNFFKLLFMGKTEFMANDFMMNDALAKEIIESGRKLTGFDYKTQKNFHLKVWIFTHGIACFVATKTVSFTDEEVSDLLESTVREMYIGYRK